MLKLFLDDERPAPNESWTHAKTAKDAIQCIAYFGKHLTHLSLDHDLGSVITGYDVICELERLYFENAINPELKVTIHSANPAGAKKMAMACVKMFGEPWTNYIVDYFALCRFENWRDDERL